MQNLVDLNRFDDNGDGKGREASAEGPDGGVARIAYLDSEVVPANANPELATLIKRRQTLEQQAEEHKQLKGVMPDAEWQSQFEKLMLELAQVSAEDLAALGERACIQTDLDRLVARVVDDARPGDRILVMSNGGFGGIHGRLLAALGASRDA